ncbi:20972_t:CDS:1, partial [Gigaspora margarita]
HTDLIKHYISMKNALPIKYNLYRYSPAKKQIIKTKINRILREDLIQP